jgi:predicted methyltransferase
VLWLRAVNPWSPHRDVRLTLQQGDIAQEIVKLPARGFDAILHDPPRFAKAGELYSQGFYEQLARVLAPHGVLFHYTGTPNKVSRGRNLPKEVQKRLAKAGFDSEIVGDGLLARRAGRATRARSARR